MAELTVVEAVNQALTLEMARDKRVLVFGEDVGRSGGVFRATDGLFAKHGADRVIDTPLSESVIAGAAIGLALAGWVPVAEIQFLGFAHNGFNQVVDQLARVRYRSAGRFSAQVTIRAPYGGGVRAPELHSDGFEAHFAHAPGLKVVAPATPYDIKGLLLASIRDPDPVLFLEPLRGYRQVKGEVPDGDYEVEIGKARVAREGSDVTLVAWSGAVQVALQAADDAQSQGISVEVIDLRTLSPWDRETVFESVKKNSRVIVAYEDSISWGYGAEISAAIADECFAWLDAPVKRVASEDTFVGYAPRLEDAILPQVEDFKQAYEDIMKF